MLRKQAAAAEFITPVYQLKNYVVALLANRCYLFHLDNEFTAHAGLLLLARMHFLARQPTGQ